MTDEADCAFHNRYFSNDGYKVTNVAYVGERTPDADPDDRWEDLDPMKS